MGFFTNFAKLTAMGFENLVTMDTGAQLAQAQATMDSLIAQNALRTEAAEGFVPATATVQRVTSTGVVVNDGVQVALELTVLLQGGASVPVHLTTVIPMVLVPRVQPGATLPVKVDPTNPSRLVLDLW